jgi:hypothetical protein
MNFTELFTLTKEAQGYATQYRDAMKKGSYRLAMGELYKLNLTANDLSKFSGEPAQILVDRFIAGDSATLS